MPEIRNDFLKVLTSFTTYQVQALNEATLTKTLHLPSIDAVKANFEVDEHPSLSADSLSECRTCESPYAVV